MKAAFQAYLADKNSIFEKHFRNLLHKIQDDDVHELRVSIKKLRAAYHFLELQKILKPSDAKYKHDMRHLYKTSGNYREMNVFDKLTHHFETNLTSELSFLRNHLSANKEKLSVQLSSAANNFDFDKHVQFSGDLLLKLNKIPNKKMKTSLEKHLKKLRKQADKMLVTKGTQWHELRKVLKNIYFLYPVLAGNNNKKFMDYLASINDRLGSWQDCQSYSKYLTDYVVYHEVFEYENRLLINDLVIWLKDRSKQQVKGIKKTLRMELDAVQKIEISKQ
jgi:CHAD domain-containing protein